MFNMIDSAIEMLGYNSKNLETLSAIDLGCAEGFTAMYLREKGIAQIDCFDLNEEQLERFQLIEAYKDIEGSNKFIMDLERPGWALELDKSYELVLCLGVLYHMENPMLFMRNVFEITKYACILESDTPIVSKNDGGYLKQVEQQVTKKQGDIRYILELRPNINALIDMALAVGFSSVSVVEPPESATCPYLKRGTKSIIVCRR
jgi:2-polyprenyl-3-methyl-5-hydroxy-6-metoxy-1,4-benzoquinol methylase